MTAVDIEHSLAHVSRRSSHQRPPHGPVLLAADAVAVFAVFEVVAEVPLGATVAYAAAVLACVGFQGGYRRRFTERTLGSVPALVSSLAGPLVVLGAVAGSGDVFDSLLRGLPWACVAMLAARALSLAAVNHGVGSARSEPVLILGAGTVGTRLATHLQEHREFGLDPVGFVDRVDDRDLPLPLLGDVADLERIVERTGARQLIIAYGLVPETELVSVIRRCQLLDLDVWAVPRFFELGLGTRRSQRDEIWGIQLTGLPRLALRSQEWRLKRVFDVAVASVALVLFLPLLAGVAAGVKLSSQGPMFFRQTRIGQRGTTFDVLKFRTMQVNTDSSTTWSVTRDPRITPIGGILRRFSIDEIPQLWNVLRGDMSLVGPRPERPHFVDIFRGSVQNYDDRHRVPVGLTGLAQVNGLRGDTSIEQRAVFDNYYIENWSLWGDIVILLRTAIAVVRQPEGDYLEPQGRGAVATEPAA